MDQNEILGVTIGSGPRFGNTTSYSTSSTDVPEMNVENFFLRKKLSSLSKQFNDKPTLTQKTMVTTQPVEADELHLLDEMEKKNFLSRGAGPGMTESNIVPLREKIMDYTDFGYSMSMRVKVDKRKFRPSKVTNHKRKFSSYKSITQSSAGNILRIRVPLNARLIRCHRVDNQCHSVNQIHTSVNKSEEQSHNCDDPDNNSDDIDHDVLDSDVESDPENEDWKHVNQNHNDIVNRNKLPNLNEKYNNSCNLRFEEFLPNAEEMYDFRLCHLLWKSMHNYSWETREYIIHLEEENSGSGSHKLESDRADSKSKMNTNNYATLRLVLHYQDQGLAGQIHPADLNITKPTTTGSKLSSKCFSYFLHSYNLPTLEYFSTEAMRQRTILKVVCPKGWTVVGTGQRLERVNSRKKVNNYIKPSDIINQNNNIQTLFFRHFLGNGCLFQQQAIN